MITALLLTLAIAQRPYGKSHELPWVHELLSKPLASKYLAEKRQLFVFKAPPVKATASASTAGPNPWSGPVITRLYHPMSPEDMARNREQMMEIKGIRKTARDLERAGKRKEGLMFLRNSYQEHPVGLIGTLIVQMDMREGDNAQAYKDDLELEQAGNGSGLMRLALVAALNGEVAPGERNYLMRALLIGVPVGTAAQIQAEYPSGETPNALAAIAAGTLGGAECGNDHEAAIFDLKASLSLYPGNPYVLQALSFAYGEAGEFGKALRAAEQGLAVAKLPSQRSILSNSCQLERKNIEEKGEVGPAVYTPE